MERFKVNEMKYGYMVGDFDPVAMKMDNVEIAVQNLVRHTIRPPYFWEKNSEMITIISGELNVNGVQYSAGDILVFSPKEKIFYYSETGASILVVRNPGYKNDKRSAFDMYDFNTWEKFFLTWLQNLADERGFDKYSPVVHSGKIDPKNVSVVVQGYVEKKVTSLTIESVRKWLPGARIIISTWKECDVDGLECDEVILNDDPGNTANICNWEEIVIPNNINRQLLSTQKGLEHVSTEYVMKLRSDLILLGDDMLSIYNSFPKYEDKYKIFEDRLIIGEVFTRKYHVYWHNDKYDRMPLLFHPTDWFCFGKTRDVKTLYEGTELMRKEEMSNYSFKYPERIKERDYPFNFKYPPEQYIFMSAVKRKYPEFEFEDLTDWDIEKIDFSRRLVLNNFTILNMLENKVLNVKHLDWCFDNIGLRNAEQGLIDLQEFLSYYEGIKRENA